jgi:hypothetical protein
MNLDGLSLSLGMLLIPLLLVALFYFIAYLKNLGRYHMPRFLPREDEILWARLNANSTRIWALSQITGFKCVNWDLGQFEIHSDVNKRYDTNPMINDVIVAPKKWGGYHALVITSVSLVDNRYQIYAVYLGEYINGKIKPGRTGIRYNHV